jgi:ADP-ribosylation factor protein 1
MGNFSTSILKLFGFSGVIDAKILICGLDSTGKTTILNRISGKDYAYTVPTIGFNVEQVKVKGINFTSWDVGGRDKIRSLWRHYYRDCNALIFVIDSNDKDRMEEARSELLKMSNDDELRDVCILVMANKQDLPNSLPVSEIPEMLSLGSVKQNWFVQGTCATSGDGIMEGMDWIVSYLS